MTDGNRRAVVKSASKWVALAAASAVGLLRPFAAFAKWNKSAFEATTLSEALKYLNIGGTIESEDITITAPDIADNGAFVALEVESAIPGTKSIAVLIDKNPFPYVASFDVSQGALPFIAMRLKFGQSSPVRVVVAAADGKFYTAHKDVKVTIGGCA